MAESLDRIFLKFSADRLNQLASRIEDCVGRLSEDQTWARGGENENAVGNLILHLTGNVKQWILSGVGGEPDNRVRDAEFTARKGARAVDLARDLGHVIGDAAGVIEKLTPERLRERIRIQNYEVTVLEAVYHVVEHFAQHTGQIIFATKAFTGADLGYYAHLNRSAHGESAP